MARRDPLADTPELIRRIYSYVAYRVGDGPDAEDVTSEVFERALRYRKSYDPSRGEPLAWLIGIARRCLDDARTKPRAESREQPDVSSPEDLEADALQRLSVAAAVDGLDERSRGPRRPAVRRRPVRAADRGDPGNEDERGRGGVAPDARAPPARARGAARGRDRICSHAPSGIGAVEKSLRLGMTIRGAQSPLLGICGSMSPGLKWWRST